MRNFKAFVHAHLSSLALPRQRELKIVEELAAQIEESYEALIAEGLSDEEAWNERQMPDWKTLGTGFSRQSRSSSGWRILSADHLRARRNERSCRAFGRSSA